MSWHDAYTTLLDSRIPETEDTHIRARLYNLFRDAGDIYREFSGSDHPLYSRMGMPLECLAIAFELHAAVASRNERDAAFDLLVGDGLIALAFKMAIDVNEDAYRICRELSLMLIDEPDPRRIIRQSITKGHVVHIELKTADSMKTNNHGGSE